MELRGYDHYEITLGDEIRGYRASMGRTIVDVERELRIKAELIAGIENCDLSAFPNLSVVAGYVRSYARYLGMDAEDFYRRFREESGFVPPSSGFGIVSGGAAATAPGGVRMLAGSPFDQSRFAVPPARNRFAARVSLGSVASALALVGLVAGLGFGGYALLQNVQRVGFAPLPDAPEVVAEAPRIVAPDYVQSAATPPDAAVYSGGGALAAVLAPDDQPPVRRRDGPISAIDPGDYGVFARTASDGAERLAREGPGISVDEQPIGLAEARARRAAAVSARSLAELPELAVAEAAEPAPATTGIRIHALESAWIRVRNEDRSVLFEGILPPGESYVLPDRVDRGSLRAGNAGAVYILVDGQSYGPVGKPGGVVKNLSLAPADVRDAFALAPEPALPQPEIAPTAARQAAAQ